MFLMKRIVHLLQHGSMFFMPDLDPLLPLVFGQLVLIQDSAGETRLCWSVSCFLLLLHWSPTPLTPPPICGVRDYVTLSSMLCPAESLTLVSESKQSIQRSAGSAYLVVYRYHKNPPKWVSTKEICCCCCLLSFLVWRRKIPRWVKFLSTEPLCEHCDIFPGKCITHLLGRSRSEDR